MRQLVSEWQRKDYMILSLLSSLKDQMTVLGLAKPKLEYFDSSFEPERAVHWSMKFPSGSSTEHRPGMTRRSEEVPMSKGSDPNKKPGASPHMLRDEKHNGNASDSEYEFNNKWTLELKRESNRLKRFLIVTCYDTGQKAFQLDIKYDLGTSTKHHTQMGDVQCSPIPSQATLGQGSWYTTILPLGQRRLYPDTLQAVEF